MKDKKIVIYDHPNPEMKSFLLDEDISAPRVSFFTRPLAEEDETLRQLGTLGAQVVKAVLAIPSVIEIRVRPKDIRVRKEASAAWEEIEPRILTILERALRRKQMRVVRGGRK